MNNKKKIVLIISILLVSILLIVGVTYAVLSYEKEGETQELIVGDIWMKYEETNGLILEDAMPINGDGYIVNPIMATQELGEDNELTRCVDYYQNASFDEGSTVESYCKGIGTRQGGMSLQENINFFIRIAQENGFLEDFEGQELLDLGIIIPQLENLPYFEFTISGKNTYTKKDIWYEIVLNHGDIHETRTTRIRDNLLKFSLIEIKDGKETIVINNKRYNDLNNRRIWVNTIDKNTNEEVSITYRLYMWIDENTIIGNNQEDYTLEEWEDVFASIKVNVTGDFNEKELAPTDASCFEVEETVVYTRNENMTADELNTCVSLFRDEFNYELEGDEDFESFCQGTGTLSGFLFDQGLFNSYYNQEKINLLNINNIVIENKGLTIIDYNLTCGGDIIIPSDINGNNIIEIKDFAFNSKDLLSVMFPKTVLSINRMSFSGNYLSSVDIPTSVKFLSCQAFDSGVIINKSDNLSCIWVDE